LQQPSYDDDALELPLQLSYDDDALGQPLEQPSYDDDALELPLQLSYDALQPRSVPFRMVRSVTEPVARQIVALIGQSFHYLGKINWMRVGILFLKKVCVSRFFSSFYPLFTRKYRDFRKTEEKTAF